MPWLYQSVLCPPAPGPPGSSPRSIEDLPVCEPTWLQPASVWRGRKVDLEKSAGLSPISASAV